ncbi:MAG: hypothetical protein ACJ73S_09940 [Mycobacteriales bacterium]
MLVLLVTPLLLMGALRLTITQDSPAPAAGSCTLVGSTWSCTGLPSARAPPRALLGGDDRQPVGGPGRGEVISGRGP